MLQNYKRRTVDINRNTAITYRAFQLSTYHYSQVCLILLIVFVLRVAALSMLQGNNGHLVQVAINHQGVYLMLRRVLISYSATAAVHRR